jgi:alpha-galactosidase
MNLPDNDEWTTALLTNPEVLAVNQDSAGKPAKRFFIPGLAAELWCRELADGSQAVGLFNRTGATAKVQLQWSELGILSAPEVRDLWLRKNLGKDQKFTSEIPAHGCVLLTLQP